MIHLLIFLCGGYLVEVPKHGIHFRVYPILTILSVVVLYCVFIGIKELRRLHKSNGSY